MVLSKFNCLPPELIVEISDYLDGCDLYYAFYGLNQRIDRILDQQCHRLHVSFICIPKVKFDLYCNRILSHIGGRIVSLTLGGDKSSTPGQVTLFLTHFYYLASVFVKLESFKLLDFTKSDVQSLLPYFPALTHLKCLSIGEYKCLMPFSVNTDELINENVILPISLRSLAFPYEVSNEWIETSNAISFVEQLHVHYIHMNSLSSFLQRFPHLKRLTAVFGNVNGNNLQMENMLQSNVAFHALQYLHVNIRQQVHFDHFAWFLRSVPQLVSLSVEALNPDLAFLEAHRWEVALPLQLHLFRFDLTMTLTENPNHLDLLESFKSEFWVSRGWFVQCRLRDRGRYFRLSTVQSPIITVLHWPDDEVLLDSTATARYSNVTHIELWWNLSKSTQSICPNVRSIQLYGARNENNEPFHANICDLLQYPSLEHIIVNNNLPITPSRFASVLAKSSSNVHMLTCSPQWLCSILDDKQYEWICLLITMRIRKLIIATGGAVTKSIDLIAFCRTFINLQEITMDMVSAQDLFFLLNTAKQLTMASITLPKTDVNNITNITQWIQQNTILIDFVVHKREIDVYTCKLIFWIGSRRTSNSPRTTNDLYLKHPIINQHISES